MKTKSIVKITAVCAAMGLSLSACATSGDPDGSTNGEGSGKDTLIYARAADSDYLDPALSTSGETARVSGNVVETLVNFDFDGSELKVTDTGLAKSWEASDDGTAYTFELQQGVDFQDGTPFDAEAVVYNFERWKKGSGEFPFYPAEFGGYGDDGNITEINAVDEHSVEFLLEEPDALFPNSLAVTSFAISSPKAIEAGTNNDHPVGTGAFEFVNWKPNDSITLKKNENYWKDGYPKLDQIVFKVITDPSARVTALSTGEVDLVSDLNPVDIGQIEDDFNVMYRPPLNVGFLGMTVTRAPFDNVKVRQAMNHAVDQQALVKSFFYGKAEIATNPYPSTMEGYNDQVQPYAYDPDKAKSLLAEAGFDKGFEMDLWAMPVSRPYMPNGQKVAEMIQAQLGEVGIKANIVSYDWATYVEKVEAGEADAFLLGGTSSNGTASGILDFQFKSNALGDSNYIRYKNPKLDDILNQVQGAVDPDDRVALLEQAQQIIHDEALWVPLVHSTPALASVEDLVGVNPLPTGSEHLATAYFE